jgi:radical SAM protein with 4Fe4S-binding SPASM domain
VGDCACDVSPGHFSLLTSPSHFFLELTSNCNNACSGCGNVYSHQRNSRPLSVAEWCKVIERLPLTTARLRLTGGEPTLHPEFAQIVSHVNAKSIPFAIFTNARWSNPKAVIRFWVDKQNLECILISIHGARANSHEAFTAVPGSFDEVVNNASRAVQAGLPVVTSTVITHQNHQEMEEIVLLARSIGVQRSTFSRFIGPPLPGIEASETELAVAVQAIERLGGSGHHAQPNKPAIRFGSPVPRCFISNRSNGCMAGFVHATIDPWGNLRPCPHVPIIAGNVLEQDFETIWRSPTMEAWRKELLAQCDGCSHVDQCRSACLAQAMWRKMPKDPLIQ